MKIKALQVPNIQSPRLPCETRVPPKVELTEIWGDLDIGG